LNDGEFATFLSFATLVKVLGKLIFVQPFARVLFFYLQRISAIVSENLITCFCFDDIRTCFVDWSDARKLQMSYVTDGTGDQLLLLRQVFVEHLPEASWFHEAKVTQ
tara:strand:- start:545 stop:865 length:321 start_codon:yes stop_codon:yes gene_type:complete